MFLDLTGGADGGETGADSKCLYLLCSQSSGVSMDNDIFCGEKLVSACFLRCMVKQT